MNTLKDRRRVVIVTIAATIVTICLMLTLRTPHYELAPIGSGMSSNSESKSWWEKKPGGYEEEHKVSIHDDNPDIPQPPPSSTHTSVKPQEEEKKEKLAIVTFLSGTLNQKDDDLDNDNYFVATRMLVWQLLHQEDTRVERDDIDVLVMVTPSVTESRRARLQKDGATIYPVEFVEARSDWFKTTDHEHRWDDMFTKYRAWEMTQYSRILLLDGDIILRGRIDGIFDDPGAQFRPTLRDANRTAVIPQNTTDPIPELPDKYVIAGLGETAHAFHPFPPTWEDGLQRFGVFNAGFFMLSPSKALYDLYVAILNTPNGFDPKYPEQNILNMVHDWSGPMPWKEIDYKWNIVHVNDADMDGGVVSIHLKWFWKPQSKSEQVMKLSQRVRWEMHGWYHGRDLALEGKAR